MTQATQSERTETKRFTADDAPFSAADLVAGDRVDPSLVASTLDGLGHTRSPRPDAAPTQLAEATITDRYDDVHRALLVDGESGALVRASRHDSQAAWSQREADWKVRATGERVDVASAEVDQDGNDEWTDADAAAEAEAWANVVLQDRARGATDYSDELTLTSGGALALREPYGPTKVFADVELATAGGGSE
jgi:hypothetical protein